MGYGICLSDWPWAQAVESDSRTPNKTGRSDTDMRENEKI